MSNNDHERVLIKRTHSLLESGKYSDLTVTCRGREFRVHRHVLCLASKFFEAACDGKFKEAESRSIDLSEDDPHTLERLFIYLYSADYNDEDAVKEMQTKVDGAQDQETNGSVAKSVTDSNHDASAQSNIALDPGELKDVADDTIDRIGAPASAPLNNVLVYALAEKYDIKPLKELARCKFEIRSSESWHDSDILHILKEIYRTTPAADRGLRDIIINVCSRYMDDLMVRGEFRQILNDDASLAFEMLNRVHCTTLKLGEQLLHLERDNVRLQVEETSLKNEIEWTKTEKRLLKENLVNHGKCRHCSQGLDLSVVRASTVQMRCRHCKTKYSVF